MDINHSIIVVFFWIIISIWWVLFLIEKRNLLADSVDMLSLRHTGWKERYRSLDNWQIQSSHYESIGYRMLSNGKNDPLISSKNMVCMGGCWAPFWSCHMQHGWHASSRFIVDSKHFHHKLSYTYNWWMKCHGTSLGVCLGWFIESLVFLFKFLFFFPRLLDIKFVSPSKIHYSCRA